MPSSFSRYYSQSVLVTLLKDLPDSWFVNSLPSSYLNSFYGKTESYKQYHFFLSCLKSRDIILLLFMSSFGQRLSKELLEIKGKEAMYQTNTSDKRCFKNLKPETIQFSIEPKLYISSSIQNIIRDLLSTSSYPSPYLVN